MNNSEQYNNTSAFYFLAWASFIIATVSMVIGIIFLPAAAWIKGYLGVGFLFSITTCLTLAKTIRDKHENEKIINRLKGAKTEKLLHEYEKISMPD